MLTLEISLPLKYCHWKRCALDFVAIPFIYFLIKKLFNETVWADRISIESFFSPGYFREKFEKEGINDCSYDAYPLETIDRLPSLLQSTPGLKGLNVTIPFKQSVYKYLDDSTAIPPGLNSCNTISINWESFMGSTRI